MYQDYAPFYDGSGQIRFAVLFSQYLDILLDHYPIDGHTALDLACGTGTLALILADRGYRVVGIDQSDAMLAIARSRVPTTRHALQPRFLQADIRALGNICVDERFDLVTCSYDSLNYLQTEQELLACFMGVATLLQPGGLFIADMNTRFFLAHGWERSSVITCPGYVQIAQSHFEPEHDRVEMVLSGFVGNDEQGYRRFDELHVERAFEPILVARLLAQAGLQVEASYDCFTLQPAHAESVRIAWVARRPHIHN